MEMTFNSSNDLFCYVSFLCYYFCPNLCNIWSVDSPELELLYIDFRVGKETFAPEEEDQPTRDRRHGQ